MNSCQSPCEAPATDVCAAIRARALVLGAVAAGCAPAGEVDADIRRLHEQWVAQGRCGDMAFCRRYADLRSDPRLLLAGARTVVSCAFPYPHDHDHDHDYDHDHDHDYDYDHDHDHDHDHDYDYDHDHDYDYDHDHDYDHDYDYDHDHDYDGCIGPRIAAYAHGADYHLVVRTALEQLAGYIRERWGGETRVCVDTAPIRERYWAQRCGLGHIGLNNQLIVPGAGSYVFLGEVLWTGEAQSAKCKVRSAKCEVQDSCLQCGACVRACPNGALDGLGGCDASRCVSYLTIEHRGSLPQGLSLAGYIYGCDICQRVCPENRLTVPPQPTLFDKENPLMRLTPDQLAALGSGAYRRLIADSAMNRVPLKQLLRNLEFID